MFGFVPLTPVAPSRTLTRISTSSRTSLGRVANRGASRLLMSQSTAAPVEARPNQVVLKPLPRVYVYDHCPYATRVRYCMGVKNVKHEVIWLLNDDVDTPTALVGKKVVPIFQPNGVGGVAVMESMDICAEIDRNERYGPTNHFRPATGRTDIAEWFSKHATTIRRLTRPRLVKAYLPEFASSEARAAYIRNHPLPEPSSYEENLQNSYDLILDMQYEMPLLDDMIYSIECCTEGGISFDDIDLFPRLRTLSLVEDLVMPSKMETYLLQHSNISDVGTYDVFAS